MEASLLSAKNARPKATEAIRIRKSKIGDQPIDWVVNDSTTQAKLRIMNTEKITSDRDLK